MSAPARVAVAGAGQIGQRHAQALRAAQVVSLACIADPAPGAADFAAAMGVPHHPTLEAAIAAGGLDGVILATPNQAHLAGGLACIGAGLPVLVEKPLADSVASARQLVEAAEAAGVPLAVGHHRRHNPLITRAKTLIDEGALGRIAAVHGSTWLMKPDDYFDIDWRRQPGAGPIYINLIHDVDLLAHLCGPIVRVQAMESNAVRGFAVEDTAVILLRFASGALGTVTLSDTAAAPWSWEQTARENPDYPTTGQDCYRIAGTHGALALPDLALWRHPEARSWFAPIATTRFPVQIADPLLRQVEQFGAVIRDGAPPLVPGADGLRALRVVAAVKQAATTGMAVDLDGPA